MERIINEEMICLFREHLYEDEKSKNTIEKYIRDVRKFMCFAKSRPVDRCLVLEYKNYLSDNFCDTSSNSMLAALSSFFHYLGWYDCCVKQFKIQRQMYYPESLELTKEEYIRLVNTARERGNKRLALILQTICATGIRIGELSYITVEGIRNGAINVKCKGKTRVIFIVNKLKNKLLKYAKEVGIYYGEIFLTSKGKALSRTAVWREMKALCKYAKVSEKKVFPHNLRHLFARTFYKLEKDIAKLADILGHSSINTTRIYIVTTGAEHRQTMEKMGMIV